MIKKFFGALFFLAAGFGMLWFFSGSVYSDITADRASMKPAFEYRVTEAGCRTKAFVFNSCDIGVENMLTGEEVDFDYFLFAASEGAEVYAMKNSDGYLTTNIGMESLTSRVLLLAFFVGSPIWMGFKVLMIAFGGSTPKPTHRKAPAVNPRREARRRALMEQEGSSH